MMASVCEFTYRTVARHRQSLSRLARILSGNQIDPPTYRLVRRIFLQLLGVVYFIAFISLAGQVEGLVGADGIFPADRVLRIVEQSQPPDSLSRFHVHPTFSWFNDSDGFLQVQCVAGIAISALLIAGIAPLPCLLLLWMLYLSLVTVGGIFMGFQWDNLLLETGFLAIFLAPVRLWPNLAKEGPPSRIVIWLFRWLLFRLMFASGCVKLLSGDPTWRDLTALNFHYETQPLPTVIGWYAHHLPEWFQKLSCIGMFGVELVVPFFIFLPRRARWIALWSFIGLQVSIAITGNYTFFNLLTVLLCLLLLDDRMFMQLCPRWLPFRSVDAETASANAQHPMIARLRLAVVSVLALTLLSITSLQFIGMFSRSLDGPGPMLALYRWAAPLRSANSYGLFAVMTTTRAEIIVEGSDDGQSWHPYEFHHKPGDLTRRPEFVAPHQPRLDWQMWFAALGTYEANPWFVHFCLRLLQGSPKVLGLLEHNPFPDAPPKFIRASLYHYHVTDLAERRATGTWWRREFRGLYCPTLSSRRKDASALSEP
jgi:hypothetical protein